MTKTHSNEHLLKEKGVAQKVAQKETQIFLAEHILLSSSLFGDGAGGRGGWEWENVDGLLSLCYITTAILDSGKLRLLEAESTQVECFSYIRNTF